MPQKLFLRIICCVSLMFFAGAEVGAFGFFSKTDGSNVEQAKLLYDNSLEILEKDKVECWNLFGDLDSVLSEIENTRVEFKLSLERLEEQFQRLNEAYSSWEALGYPIKGEEYAVYNEAKDEFEKTAVAYRLNREAFKSCCQKVECLLTRDAKILDEYKMGMNNSINSYYNYGIALAKNDSIKN